MTDADLLSLARKAGFKVYAILDTHLSCNESLARFAKMVATRERGACLACYSPDDSAHDWADKINQREYL